MKLPWAADKAIQQLGRSHRSGQVSAPIYHLVVTELGGERRFASAVSGRMKKLGALTKGDRRAAPGQADLAAFDVDSIYGKRTLRQLYSWLPIDEGTMLEEGKNESQSLMIRQTLRQALIDVELVPEDPSSSIENPSDVKRFLNRIAGLEVERQNFVFRIFSLMLENIVSSAKATGEYEASVEDVRATTVEIDGDPEVIAVDRSSGAKTEFTKIVLDRGVSLLAIVKEILLNSGNCPPIFSLPTPLSPLPALTKDSQITETQTVDSGFYVSKRKIAGRELILYATKKSVSTKFDSAESMIITRPNTGRNAREMSVKDILMKYRLLVTANTILSCYANRKDKERGNDKDFLSIFREKYSSVYTLWDNEYTDSDNFKRKNGHAPRKSKIGLVNGAVLHIFDALEKAVSNRGNTDRSLRVTRVKVTKPERHLVGVRFPVDDDAVARLKFYTKSLAIARGDNEDLKTGASRSFLESDRFKDEPLTSIDERMISWATTEPKTIRSFFAVCNKNNTENGKRKKNNKQCKKKVVDKGTKNKKAKSTSVAFFFKK